MSELYKMLKIEGAFDRLTMEHIFIEENRNAVSFHIQEGPVKEAGKNGCQIDALLGFVREFIGHHNKKFPCRENSCAITKLDEALHWLKARTDRRTAELIEGTKRVYNAD